MMALDQYTHLWRPKVTSKDYSSNVEYRIVKNWSPQQSSLRWREESVESDQNSSVSSWTSFSSVGRRSDSVRRGRTKYAGLRSSTRAAARGRRKGDVTEESLEAGVVLESAEDRSVLGMELVNHGKTLGTIPEGNVSLSAGRRLKDRGDNVNLVAIANDVAEGVGRNQENEKFVKISSHFNSEVEGHTEIVGSLDDRRDLLESVSRNAMAVNLAQSGRGKGKGFGEEIEDQVVTMETSEMSFQKNKGEPVGTKRKGQSRSRKRKSMDRGGFEVTDYEEKKEERIMEKMKMESMKESAVQEVPLDPVMTDHHQELPTDGATRKHRRLSRIEKVLQMATDKKRKEDEESVEAARGQLESRMKRKGSRKGALSQHQGDSIDEDAGRLGPLKNRGSALSQNTEDSIEEVERRLAPSTKKKRSRQKPEDGFEDIERSLVAPIKKKQSQSADIEEVKRSLVAPSTKKKRSQSRKEDDGIEEVERSLAPSTMKKRSLSRNVEDGIEDIERSLVPSNKKKQSRSQNAEDGIEKVEPSLAPSTKKKANVQSQNAEDGMNKGDLAPLKKKLPPTKKKQRKQSEKNVVSLISEVEENDDEERDTGKKQLRLRRSERVSEMATAMGEESGKKRRDVKLGQQLLTDISDVAESSGKEEVMEKRGVELTRERMRKTNRSAKGSKSVDESESVDDSCSGSDAVSGLRSRAAPHSRTGPTSKCGPSSRPARGSKTGPTSKSGPHSRVNPSSKSSHSARTGPISKPNLRSRARQNVITNPDAVNDCGSKSNLGTRTMSNSRSESGADSETVSGPDSRIVAGPDSRNVSGPDFRSVSGPDSRTVPGSDSRTVSFPDSGSGLGTTLVPSFRSGPQSRGSGNVTYNDVSILVNSKQDVSLSQVRKALEFEDGKNTLDQTYQAADATFSIPLVSPNDDVMEETGTAPDGDHQDDGRGDSSGGYEELGHCRGHEDGGRRELGHTRTRTAAAVKTGRARQKKETKTSKKRRGQEKKGNTEDVVVSVWCPPSMKRDKEDLSEVDICMSIYDRVITQALDSTNSKKLRTALTKHRKLTQKDLMKLIKDPSKSKRIEKASCVQGTCIYGPTPIVSRIFKK